MTRIRSARSVWTTTRRRSDGVTPMVMKRASSVECSGSGIVAARGSPNTTAASSNDTPWCWRFDAAFSGSHSNCTHRCYGLCPSSQVPSWSAEHSDELRRPRFLARADFVSSNPLLAAYAARPRPIIPETAVKRGNLQSVCAREPRPNRHWCSPARLLAWPMGCFGTYIGDTRERDPV